MAGCRDTTSYYGYSVCCATQDTGVRNVGMAVCRMYCYMLYPLLHRVCMHILYTRYHRLQQHSTALADTPSAAVDAQALDAGMLSATLCLRVVACHHEYVV